jgi:hypothetical protein
MSSLDDHESAPGRGERDSKPSGREPADPDESASDGSKPDAGDGEAGGKKGDDPDAKLVHAETPVPSLDELHAAMEWAFAGVDVEPALLGRYAEHARAVLAGNQRMNLTAIVAPKEVAAKHYLDSWRATRIVPLAGRSLLDVGTGAGFPGVPIALAEPHARVGLLDSQKKRADFVGQTIAELAIKNAFAVSERA